MMGKVYFARTGFIFAIFLNEGSFDEGDFVAEKTVGSNNERVFTDGTKSATVKNIDTSLQKLNSQNKQVIFHLVIFWLTEHSLIIHQIKPF